MEGVLFMNLDQLTHSILELANRLIGTRTLFISVLNNEEYRILKVINNGGSNIEEGAELPFSETL
jgi:hypothetical protein